MTAPLTRIELIAHRGGDEFDALTPNGLAIVKLNGDADAAIKTLKACAGTVMRPAMVVHGDQVAKVG